jgi:hypothetical protein
VLPASRSQLAQSQCRPSRLPGLRYVRLTASSPTYGPVTLVIVEQPGRDRYYLLCRETTILAPVWSAPGAGGAGLNAASGR